MFTIGCHLSTSVGYEAMGKTAIELGANTFQFFTRNPRGGGAKAIDPEDARKLNEFLKENNFGKLVAHAPYTLNPASAKYTPQSLRDSSPRRGGGVSRRGYYGLISDYRSSFRVFILNML